MRHEEANRQAYPSGRSPTLAVPGAGRPGKPEPGEGPVLSLTKGRKGRKGRNDELHIDE